MPRTRDRAKGRKGGEQEFFARIPEDVMRSNALKTAPHAALRVLTILLMGRSEPRNGLMACTDSYAATFGVTSRETVYRSLQLLKDRGIIVCTRQGMRMRKIPTLWAVTWWRIYYRDGQPLDRPEEASYAYREWKAITSTFGGDAINSHTDHRGGVTPTVGVENTSLHTDSEGQSRHLHTDSREYSRSWGGGTGAAKGKVVKLMTLQPHLTDSELSRITGAPIELVSQVRQSA